MIIEKSNEVNIDLNAKNYYQNTAFHLACMRSYFENAMYIAICPIGYVQKYVGYGTLFMR